MTDTSTQATAAVDVATGSGAAAPESAQQITADALKAAAGIAVGAALTGAAGPQAAEIATAVQLAPEALNLLTSASKLANAGALSPAQLAAMFEQVGSGIKATHDQWEAMNTASATSAA